jgi:hypothetical protein
MAINPTISGAQYQSRKIINICYPAFEADGAYLRRSVQLQNNLQQQGGEASIKTKGNSQQLTMVMHQISFHTKAARKSGFLLFLKLFGLMKCFLLQAKCCCHIYY